jgi:tRNA(His) guanylyltransferase
MINTLGDRLKRYENSYESQIIGRIPIIIRLDGKNFSNWTKKIHAIKPFDDMLSYRMANAMLATAEKIEGCVFGYTQSDEITFVLRNDQSLESTPWFNNRIQKMCSIASSMITAHFNDSISPSAYFDARVFAVPTIQESINCLVWRQQDCVKNSISCSCYCEVAKVHGNKTARKMMDKLNQKQQQELLFKETKINWNDYPAKFKRGIGCYKKEFETIINNIPCNRTEWILDYELPIFSKEQIFLQNMLSLKGDIQ